MNKTELIAAITEKTGFTKKDAEKALNSVVDVITESLVKGEKVQIVGFGSFEVKARPERVARNPQAPAVSTTARARNSTPICVRTPTTLLRLSISLKINSVTLSCQR